MSTARHDALVTRREAGTVPLRGSLIVLPGRGESPEVYERFGRRLAADAYRVYVASSPAESPELALEQLRGVLAEADSGTPRVVVGSDAGAAYAAHLASTHQLAGASALILAGLPTVSSAAPGQGWDAELDERTACTTHRSRISAAGVRAGEIYRELPAAWFAPTVAGSLDLPVLGIHGRDDAVSPFAQARNWYSEVPRAELVAIAGGRHDALNDATHRTVAATVVLFLERLRAGRSLDPIATVEVPELVAR